MKYMPDRYTSGCSLDEELMSHPIPAPGSDWWPYGTRVRKIRGSSWHGRVVGFYSNTQTPEGYNVESEREPGSTQIYPRAALERVIE